MKTFDKKDVYSWANCEEVNQYMGKEGYFAESISILERDIEQQHTSRLIGVNTTEVCCFHARNKGNYSLFLPIDKVKKPEKKWRAFKNIREFADTLGIENKFLVGASVKWRYKNKHSNQGVSLITNTFISPEEEIFITLGFQTYIIGRLFTDLEWLDKDGNWQPFGVKE